MPGIKPKLFKHVHPYPPFLFKEATKLIVGTLPPPRFTTGDLKPGDVDFCYGSRDGQLWRILDRIFELGLLFETSERAVHQRRDFLLQRKIGICDIIDRADRTKVDASDIGMQNIILRDLLAYLKAYKNVDTLLFTGGNSKNGPEYLFRRLLKEHGLSLNPRDKKVPRIHQFDLPGEDSIRVIRTVSLTAPSGSANRAVGSIAEYKRAKERDPSYTTIDFRVLQYRSFF
ncbi:MAG: uracil-DNA glycosylase family protein [Bacteroidia bacterium]|nr:uracil-DNA glycosylase family protein [Bacteroidia bacterium]